MNLESYLTIKLISKVKIISINIYYFSHITGRCEILNMSEKAFFFFTKNVIHDK